MLKRFLIIIRVNTSQNQSMVIVLSYLELCVIFLLLLKSHFIESVGLKILAHFVFHCFLKIVFVKLMLQLDQSTANSFLLFPFQPPHKGIGNRVVVHQYFALVDLSQNS
jgi:hypothetical protein